MTINRNLSILAESAGAANKPVLDLANISGKTTTSATAATGTINFDILTQSVLYYTANATANWTLNLRGSASVTFASFIDVGQSVDIKFYVTNGATAYVPSAFNIDGTAVTVVWAGGSAPSSGTANGVDQYSYTVVCTGAGTYTVFGQRSTATAAAPAAGGGFSNMDVLTSGTSWTAPAGITKIKVTATGGGGGAGLIFASTSLGNLFTSSGGAGGTAIKIFTVVPGTSYTCAVGSFGAASTTPGSAGSNGGNTTFTVGGTTITGGGGGGGLASQANQCLGGGSGGTATNGDINVKGGCGADNNVSTYNGWGTSMGGASFWGGGNIWNQTATQYAYGSGGGGSYRSVTSGGAVNAFPGCQGTQGVIVIEY